MLIIASLPTRAILSKECTLWHTTDLAKERLKSPNVCMWERYEINTSFDCDIILVHKRLFEKHFVEVEYIYISSHIWRESLSRVMWRGYLNDSLKKPLVVSVLSLGMSIGSIQTGIITSHDQWAWLSLNLNALQPTSMDLKFGKSSQLLKCEDTTLKHNTRTLLECMPTTLEWSKLLQV